METKIEQTFQLNAPIEKTWAFLMDPESVAACMPGTTLEEVVNDRCFTGTIDVKMGFVSMSYRVRAEFVNVDFEANTIVLNADGADSGGGDGELHGTLTSVLTALGDNETEVSVVVVAQLTGRLVQFGGGMIRSVAKQLTKRFVTAAQKRLEA